MVSSYCQYCLFLEGETLLSSIMTVFVLLCLPEVVSVCISVSNFRLRVGLDVFLSLLVFPESTKSSSSSLLMSFLFRFVLVPLGFGLSFLLEKTL